MIVGRRRTHAGTLELGAGKAQRAYEWIGAEIRCRRLAPGRRLILTQLADAIGVSVAPVREALRRLEAEGLIVYERNIGATVAMIDDRQYADVMQTLAVLESHAVALAAPQLTHEDLSAAERLNDQLRTLVSALDTFDPERFTVLNRYFHEALYLPGSNTYLCELVTAGWNRLDTLRASSFSFIPGRAAASVAEHDTILAAITRRADPAELERLVRDHRLTTLQTFLARRALEVDELAVR